MGRRLDAKVLSLRTVLIVKNTGVASRINDHFLRRGFFMKSKQLSQLLRNLLAIGFTGALFAGQAQAAVDVAAAEELMKVSKCTKCHSVDKKKTGPSFKETAAKYKGKADGEAKLVTHLTTGPMVEVDGEKEAHTKVKSTDDAAIKNLAQYILTR
jgi:cytochrome c